MSHTTDPISHWEDLEAWLSAMTHSLLPKATETLRHQTQDQLDDNLTSIMKYDPCQSYSHKELAKISNSLSHTLIAIHKLKDRHAANLQKELTYLNEARTEIDHLTQQLGHITEESDNVKDELKHAYELRPETTRTRRDLTSPLPSRIDPLFLNGHVSKRGREQS
ncbi:hypothetical protein QQF64_001152 [Cirrhinus molitorella]|uniref:Uncharacterized protein n=1 Tax=Cirrhinus molitorella TaxID=172907 RepID=A0ABR3NZL0_9TELE